MLESFLTANTSLAQSTKSEIQKIRSGENPRPNLLTRFTHNSKRAGLLYTIELDVDRVDHLVHHVVHLVDHHGTCYDVPVPVFDVPSSTRSV